MKKNRKSRKNKKQSTKLFYTLLLLVFVSLVLLAQNFQDTQKSDSTQAAITQVSGENIPAELEIPLCHAQNGEQHEIHSHHGFSLCYREEYEQAEWVAYCFTRDELAKEAGRSNNFREDPSISTGSATPGDYTKSGYDRGHLAPAGDLCWSTESMSDSFFMSNMSPQEPSFNRGIWKKLEDQVRTWVENFGTVYVVSGPVLEKPAAEYKAIGQNKVSVPEYYYKALLAKDENGKLSAIAFILPNEKSARSIFDFATTIDQAEARTGIDFFSALPDEQENILEAAFTLSDWQ